MKKRKLKIPKAGFRVILADPPWHYRDKLDHPNMRGAAEDHYPVLKPEDLMELDIASLAAKDCALFLWTTGPQIDVAIDCIREWGFKYKTVAFVWRKMNTKTVDTPFFGLGRWTRSNYEYVLLGAKGKPTRVDAAVRQEIVAPRMEHSAKPVDVRIGIDNLMGRTCPKIELFARDRWPCWQATGLEYDGRDIRNVLRKIRQFRRIGVLV